MKLIKMLVTIAIINTALVVLIVNLAFPKTTLSPLPSVNPIPAASVVASALPSPKRSVTPSITTTATSTPTATPKPVGCIVTIDSVAYNVENLRITHSGGNIFTCGADMSQTFWSQHNNRILRQMQQYRI